MGVEEAEAVGVPCSKAYLHMSAGKVWNGGFVVWSGWGTFWRQRSAGYGRWMGCDVVGECAVFLCAAAEETCAGRTAGWGGL